MYPKLAHMKILTQTFLVGALVFSALCVSAHETLRPRGDVNCDWEVDIADVNVLVEAVIKGVTYHSFYTYALDVNGDCEITVADINTVITAVMGELLPPLPSFSGTLPVLYINTEGYRDITSKDKSDYLHAEWWLDPMGAVGVERLGSASDPLGMLIKGRGNYSWLHSDKKPFRLKLDTKQPLMGMKKNRHYCLLPHDHWTSPFGFELSRRIGLSYTPFQEPVEVVMNGQYIGLYLLTEKVRIGKNRVNIIEQENGETDEELITGGWLLEIDNHVDDNQFGFQEGNGNWLSVKYHSPDSLSWQQLNYIYYYLKDTDRAIYEEQEGNGSWMDYIDVDTLACFYIVNEIADNIESFTNSLFIHKQRGDSTKLMFGPVWDLGSSYGRPEQEQPCFIYENTTEVFKPHWLEKLATFPEFQNAVHRHWNRFYLSGLSGMEEYMDSLVDKILPASRADRLRWPADYIWFEDVKQYGEMYYKPQMRAKVKFLNDQWGTNSAKQGMQENTDQVDEP